MKAVLGITSPAPAGEWQNNTIYDKLSIVRSGDATYIAISQNSNIQPGVTSGWESYWQLVAADGADGADGTNGTNGIGFSNSLTVLENYNTPSNIYLSSDGLNFTLKPHASDGTNVFNFTINTVVPIQAGQGIVFSIANGKLVISAE